MTHSEENQNGREGQVSVNRIQESYHRLKRDSNKNRNNIMFHVTKTYAQVEFD